MHIGNSDVESQACPCLETDFPGLSLKLENSGLGLEPYHGLTQSQTQNRIFVF